MFSFVIPAYNEEKGIKDTILQCQKVIGEIGDENSEIVIVDDNSSDSTAEIISNFGVTVVHHPLNTGYGRSLKDGIRKAKNNIIVITDADGTYPIDFTPQLIAEFQRGIDMVVGTRKNISKLDNPFKYLFRKILKLLVEFTAGRKIPDINSGLRVFDKRTITPYFNTLSDSFSFTTSSTLAYMMTGKMVNYLPIDYHKRKGKTKVKLFKDSIRTLQYIVEAIMYYNPIKLFIAFSLFLFIIAFCNFGAYFLLNNVIFLQVSFGFTMLAFLNLGFGFISIQLKQLLSQQTQIKN